MRGKRDRRDWGDDGGPGFAIVDLDADSRRALEFDALLDWLASLSRTRLGGERLRNLQPTADGERVRRELKAVAEVRNHLVHRGPLLAGSLPDPRDALEALAVASMRLKPETLRDMATLGEAGGDLRARLREVDSEESPQLGALALQLPDLALECRTVLDGIGPEGRLEDSASAELRRIRHTITRVGERLRKMLVSILRDPDAEAVIQDDFITQRSGRYVIPVRTDAPRPLEGIVHAASSSGATRFVEPLESVELNNELVRLAEQEREEEERVLAAWSEAFRLRLPEVEDLVRAVVRIDELQARALFAEQTNAVEAEVSTAQPFRLEQARHPMLERHLREEGVTCVPLSLALEPADQVLIISGPNTGGKTVALKTLGLAVLMTQSGIPVPALEARLPLYRQVRADIGDHQSIEANLSTYSAHIRAVVSFLEGSTSPALFLFDEIGTGTEPTEGAALARSILESLQRPGVTAVATTHLGPLKAWAIGREGACCAAMEFDTDSLRPTYRILMGAAGTSAGLEIAQRLGLDPRIVSRARERLDPSSREGEDYLRRLRGLISAAEGERDQLRTRLEEVEQDRVRLLERFEKREAKLQEEATKQLDRALDELRREGRREIEAIGERRERAKAGKQWSKAEDRLRATGARHRSSLGRPETVDEGWVESGRPEVGGEVRVASLGQEGRVVGIRGSRVEVRMGSMVVAVAPGDLRYRAGEEGVPVRPTGPGRVETPMVPWSASPREIKLLGRTVDEALEELDRFLDAAVVAGHDEVRVVHGHGTGRLKSAVRRFLEAHAQVSSHRPGDSSEGGDGATVAKLS